MVVTRLPVEWSGERDPRTHPRPGDTFRSGRHVRTVSRFESSRRQYGGTWWAKESWETCTHVRYHAPRSTSRMVKARWLAWVEAAEILKIGPAPNDPNGWERRYGCRRIDREKCEAEFGWGRVYWGRLRSDGAVFEIGGHELEINWMVGGSVAEFVMVAAMIAGGSGLPPDIQADIVEAYENRNVKPGPRAVK